MATIIVNATSDTLTLVVNWEDNTALQTVTFPSNTTVFSVTHRYLNDVPRGPSSNFTVSLSLSDQHAATS